MTKAQFAQAKAALEKEWPEMAQNVVHSDTGLDAKRGDWRLAIWSHKYRKTGVLLWTCILCPESWRNEYMGIHWSGNATSKTSPEESLQMLKQYARAWKNELADALGPDSVEVQP